VKVAIPVFGVRVSPRLDFAPAFVLAEVENGKVARREMVQAAGWPRLGRIEKLARMGVDVLLCGGIDRRTALQCEALGIRVFAWVTGEAEDALRGLLDGEVDSGVMVGAGGRRCGRWRFRSGPCAQELGRLEHRRRQ